MSHRHLKSNKSPEAASLVYFQLMAHRGEFFFLDMEMGFFSLLYVNNPPNTGKRKSSYPIGKFTKISASPCCRSIISITGFLFCSKKLLPDFSEKHFCGCSSLTASVWAVYPLCEDSVAREKNQRAEFPDAGGHRRIPLSRLGHWAWGLQQKHEMNCFLSRNQSDMGWRSIFLERETFLHLLVHYIHCSITYKHRYSGVAIVKEKSEDDVLVMYSDI